MGNLLVALLLGLWAGISMVLNLSGLGVRTALISGMLAGLVVGNVEMGFMVGAQCLLMSIGFYTYGGATIPDYITGAIIGTVIAARTGDVNDGILVGTGVGLIMAQFDILGRASNTVFQHLADKALAENNIRKFEMWTVAGTLPWILARFVPVFFALLFVDQVEGLLIAAQKIAWVQNGLTVIGRALPAVGFALLLSYMDLKNYWPFMIVGYVLFAYVGVGTIGLALVGIAAAALFASKSNATTGGAQ